MLIKSEKLDITAMILCVWLLVIQSLSNQLCFINIFVEASHPIINKILNSFTQLKPICKNELSNINYSTYYKYQL